ncbi:MAG: branched-chain-amino-acid transaminase [Candidatus Aminicenantes bacterium RBG_13_63_10]|nr:MAG: branched-chain-amino-acid transaminase [Candidatus Aminicenantes bacterium RBG_13_63_10]
MTEDVKIYLNGEFVGRDKARVSVFDQGILFGDGVFEGIRAYNSRVFKCAEHVDRLFQGAKALCLDIPMDKAQTIQIVTETCRVNGVRDGYIRLVVTRGIGDLGLLPLPAPAPTVFCIAASLTLYSMETYEKGMQVITAARRRNTAGCLDPQVKSLNYLNNILAKLEAHHAGAQEALMLNGEGLVTECAGDNVFIIKDGEILTPPVHLGILNGITRRTVIRLARDMGMSVRETEFTLFNVYGADECFLTGTAAEVAPVRLVDHRIIGNGGPGPVTRKIGSAFREYAQSHGTPIFPEE